MCGMIMWVTRHARGHGSQADTVLAPTLGFIQHGEWFLGSIWLQFYTAEPQQAERARESYISYRKKRTENIRSSLAHS